ncbi:MAG: ACP S-malonyltransferase, partial [Natronospirillum sp.]
MQTAAFVFPGQGSQKTGMLAELGETFPIIRETFAEASSALDYDLWHLIQTDTDNQLSRTSITQPAILASSVAIWRLWQQQGGFTPALMAGHSLGEYSALVCSGAIPFSAAITLVRKRGEYMQTAVPAGVGSMAAIVGLDDATVITACSEAARQQVVEAVNFNSPGQVVIAGHVEAVERAIELCKAAGAKRALPLPVSAPFHCSLMQPAAEAFAEDLDEVEFSAPAVPVLQNYGLQTETDTRRIKENLVAQIFSPVPWVGTIEGFVTRGVTLVYEIGPGKVLSGLVKRIAPDIAVLAVNDLSSLKAG